MKNFLSSQACRARLLVIACGLGCAPPLLAQALPINGRWLLDDQPAAHATYTSVTIEDGSIVWRGANASAPKCVQRFSLKKEKPGTVYANGHGTKFLAGVPGSLPTYLMTISASTCGAVGADLRINFPLVYDTNNIEVIEYANGRALSARRFHREK